MNLNYAINFINNHSTDEVIEVLFGNGEVFTNRLGDYVLKLTDGYIVGQKIMGEFIFTPMDVHTYIEYISYDTELVSLD